MVPLIVNWSVAQLTVTEVIAEPPTVPVPPETTQLCAGVAGWAETVTANGVPLATGVGKAKPPFWVMTRSWLPLCRVSPEPSRPTTEPPRANALVVQVMATFETPAPAIVPLPCATVHVWLGDEGCVDTVTLYIAPSATDVVNANEPSAVTDRLSPRLSCSISPAPTSPVTVPATG